MHKLISAITALSLVAALATGAGAATKSKTTMSNSSMSGTMQKGSSMSMHCAKGKKWVKPYTKKDGTKVKGYCR